MSVIAVAARSICDFVRPWIVATLSRSSSSGTLWHVWQALLMFSSGLRTQWLLTFIAPCRSYGMWQSAQLTPLRA